MVQVELEPAVEAKIQELAREWETTESRVIEEIALRWLEDRDDYERGMKSLFATKKTISLEGMRALSDVAD
jgi:predicted transcriptional regulator